ncbi:unnamed protein product [Discosporangium mesarthrocarpum]
MDGRVGRRLPEVVVWGSLETCMANIDQAVHSPMLAMAAEDAVVSMTRWIFHTLPDIPTPDPDPAPALAPSPAPPHTSQRDDPATMPPPAPPAQEPASPPPAGDGGRGGLDMHASGEGDGMGGGSGHLIAVKYFRFLCSLLLAGSNSGSYVGGVRNGAGTPREGRAEEAGVVRGFGVWSGGIGGGRGVAPLPKAFLLRLVRLCLLEGGVRLATHPALLRLVRDDLCLALLQMARGGNTKVIEDLLPVVRCLWTTVRAHLKVQFEALFGALFLRAMYQIRREEEEDEGSSDRAADHRVGGGVGGDREGEDHFTGREREMILECLCDFVAEPAFLSDIYVNYDCDLKACCDNNYCHSHSHSHNPREGVIVG